MKEWQESLKYDLEYFLNSFDDDTLYSKKQIKEELLTIFLWLFNDQDAKGDGK